MMDNDTAPIHTLEPSGAAHRLDLGGREMAWFEAGQGKRTLVLIHGWCCQSGFWSPVVDRLASRYRIIAADLAGHGRSAPDEAADIASLGRDIARLIEHLDLVDPVLIGHSLGGPVALEAALACSRPTSVIGVDTFTDAGMYAARPEAEIAARSAGLAGDFAAAMAGLVAMITLKDPDAQLTGAIARAMGAHDPASAIALMEALLRWDLTDALEGYEGQITTLSSQALVPLIQPLPASPKVRVVELAEVGHFPMLEDPDAFCAALIAAVETEAGPA